MVNFVLRVISCDHIMMKGNFAACIELRSDVYDLRASLT